MWIYGRICGVLATAVFEVVEVRSEGRPLRKTGERKNFSRRNRRCAWKGGYLVYPTSLGQVRHGTGIPKPGWGKRKRRKAGHLGTGGDELRPPLSGFPTCSRREQQARTVACVQNG